MLDIAEEDCKRVDMMKETLKYYLNILIFWLIVVSRHLRLLNTWTVLVTLMRRITRILMLSGTLCLNTLTPGRSSHERAKIFYEKA